LYVAVGGIISYPFCLFWFCLWKLTINTEGIFFQNGAGYVHFISGRDSRVVQQRGISWLLYFVKPSVTLFVGTYLTISGVASMSGLNCFRNSSLLKLQMDIK
jgi:hypothetical protein